MARGGKTKDTPHLTETVEVAVLGEVELQRLTEQRLTDKTGQMGGTKVSACLDLQN